LRNIKLVLEYDGTNYHGWQVQPGLRTIQGVLEGALRRMFAAKINLYGAGRTDAGVHAWGQVANFLLEHSLALDKLILGLNSLLPADIVVRAAAEVAPDFQARYSARSKTYVYRLYNRRLPSAFERNYAWHIPYALDVAAMRQAAECLLGEHDFSAFQAAGCVARNPVRRILGIDFSKEAVDVWRISITANGFLRHMVRNIIGTLVEVGRKRRPPEWVAEVLASRSRQLAGRTAPPQGLFLARVEY